MTAIVQKDDGVLREIAAEVPLQDIKGVKIKRILKSMETALETQEDGVALAAPQIGVSLRIFVVAKGAVRYSKRPTMAERIDLKKEKGVLVFINPKITKFARDKEILDEGCLSVRWLYGKIKRSKKASIEAYDENGVFFTRGASGLLAQIFQHETDHLNGILFTDNATELREMPPAEGSRD